jgi:hypothetical protein
MDSLEVWLTDGEEDYQVDNWLTDEEKDGKQDNFWTDETWIALRFG